MKDTDLLFVLDDGRPMIARGGEVIGISPAGKEILCEKRFLKELKLEYQVDKARFDRARADWVRRWKAHNAKR